MTKRLSLFLKNAGCFNIAEKCTSAGVGDDLDTC